MLPRTMHRRSTLALVSSALCVLGLAAPRSQASDFHLYLLGGQSNMDGFGQVAELPEALQGEQPDTFIFHGNSAPDGVPVDGRGRWEALRPGHGVGFSSDGQGNQPSTRFGVELSLAARLRALQPGVKLAFVKYSRGGTSIDARAAGGAGCWDPDFDGGEGLGRGVNQYDHCLAALAAATAVTDIDGDGEPDRLLPAGIVWMQGESDASDSPAVALAYVAQLGRLMDLLRAALRRDDLPVAIGRISDSGQDASGRVWTHGEVVRAAQQAWCEADAAAALVTSTDGYGYSDPYHYDSAGYIDLGARFAEALVSLPSGGDAR